MFSHRKPLFSLACAAVLILLAVSLMRPAQAAEGLLWGQHYAGPANSASASAMAVDAAGNVYVTGAAYNGANDDFATIKYDTNGNQIWVQTYDGPASGNDEPKAIAVDSQGNVWVTGYSYDGFRSTFTTIKYTSNGNQLWAKSYSGINYSGQDSYNVAEAIAMDSQGNAYITGYSDNGDTFTSESATIKYAPNGVQLWVQTYDGPANVADTRALTLDSQGNVYVTGFAYNGASDDFLTIKYDTAGNLLWVQGYDGPANGSDAATAIAVDATGNVYVTGDAYNGSSDDYATVKSR